MIVKHFKREKLTNEELRANPNMYMYKIVGEAIDTETGEKLMIYTSLYESNNCALGQMFARPYDMFMAKVDVTKYPDIKQEYRFERV